MKAKPGRVHGCDLFVHGASEEGSCRLRHHECTPFLSALPRSVRLTVACRWVARKKKNARGEANGLACGQRDEGEVRDGMGSPNETVVASSSQAEAVPRGKMFLTVEEAAQRLGVTMGWIYERTRRKAIPHRKLGKFVRFTEEDLRAISEAAATGSLL